MRTFTTPGVTIEEVASFPPSVAPVATAIPAFIGHVQNANAPNGTLNFGISRRITSLLEFETLYGVPDAQAMTISATKRLTFGGTPPDGPLLGVDVSFTTPPEAVPVQPRLLYHAMQLYFSNDGGPCYIHAIDATGVNAAAFGTAITALEAVDEVTILCFPDALVLGATDYGNVVRAALQSCNRTQDRFTVADVPDAFPLAATAPLTGNVVNTNALVTTHFRDNVGLVSEDFLKYGATYFPFLNTSIGRLVDESTVTVDAASSQIIRLDVDGVPEAPTPLLGADASLDSTALQGDAADPAGTPGEKAVVDAIRAFLRQSRITMPPSSAIAGIYARVDRTNGVHHAPANEGVLNVIEPAVPITNDLNGQLNVDPTSGKSVNVIRSFTGRGTLVWGARTLAGNSNENRYVPVRRFLNFAEESIEKATGSFVFAPNNKNTWVRIRTMIENFLTVQWRTGALVGPKPEQAFDVRVGLNLTMTAEDILNGLLIVRVGLAIVRPAEFIHLQFVQIQQQA